MAAAAAAAAVTTVIGAEWLAEDPDGREPRPPSSAASTKELPDKPTTNGWWTSRPNFPSGGEWSAQGVAAEAQANREAAGATVRPFADPPAARLPLPLLTAAAAGCFGCFGALL